MVIDEALLRSVNSDPELDSVLHEMLPDETLVELAQKYDRLVLQLDALDQAMQRIGDDESMWEKRVQLSRDHYRVSKERSQVADLLQMKKVRRCKDGRRFEASGNSGPWSGRGPCDIGFLLRCYGATGLRGEHFLGPGFRVYSGYGAKEMPTPNYDRERKAAYLPP